ncbi:MULTISPECIES: hypothetical protein [Micromonospora]|uniref:Uncharacterized protein n=1 Tax=Micromonospora rosaria TaxID=47874 RepID=A0A136PID0_9ACTN|nr:hypothetical protein [Micromonospora rosaria]KXK58151.1 hypothetical protein AWW66_31465 [Micromonospora rosaria]
MNEPVTSDTYAAEVRRLAELTARVHTQRQEAHRWHDQQCAAAERAVIEATEQVRRAEAEVEAARELLERVDAEAAHLWQQLRDRVGGGRKVGSPPGPARDATGDPLHLLQGVRDLLGRVGQPGELPGSVNPVLVLCGVFGAAVAYALGLVARGIGQSTGGDLAVGMPVLALVVTLLGPLIGLVPAKRVADRRHAVFGPRPMAVVLLAGLACTTLLLVLGR